MAAGKEPNNQAECRESALPELPRDLQIKIMKIVDLDRRKKTWKRSLRGHTVLQPTALKSLWFSASDHLDIKLAENEQMMEHFYCQARFICKSVEEEDGDERVVG